MADASRQVNAQWVSVRDHTRWYRGFSFVYPVISRRAQGLSLGINLNPDKICNFNCVYCEVDRTQPGWQAVVTPAELRAELTALVRRIRSGSLAGEPRFKESAAFTTIIRDLAFSGDGEPTLVKGFDALVQAVVQVKQDEGLSDTKIVLITNTAGLDKAEVRRGLALMDPHQGEVWAKLDAGTEDYYRRVNRSHILFERLLRNIEVAARERAIIIQSMFFRLHGQPISSEELIAYCARIENILKNRGRIRAVHAYTIARPTQETYATRLEAEPMESLAEVIRQRTGLPVFTFL